MQTFKFVSRNTLTCNVSQSSVSIRFGRSDPPLPPDTHRRLSNPLYFSIANTAVCYQQLCSQNDGSKRDLLNLSRNITTASLSEKGLKKFTDIFKRLRDRSNIIRKVENKCDAKRI